MNMKETGIVKLQRNLAYKYKNTKHYKHLVVIPKSMIDRLGWGPDTELNALIEGDNLVLKRKVSK